MQDQYRSRNDWNRIGRSALPLTMAEGTYEEGYRAGWEGVAGTEPLPRNPTRPTDARPDDYACGFKYGRADALERFKPRK